MQALHGHVGKAQAVEGQRIGLGGMQAGALHFEVLAGNVPQDGLRHQGAGRIGLADKQHALSGRHATTPDRGFLECSRFRKYIRDHRAGSDRPAMPIPRRRTISIHDHARLAATALPALLYRRAGHRAITAKDVV